MDGVKTGIFLSDSDQQFRRRIKEVADLYFTLLDSTGISPTLILNQNAKAKREEAGSLSKTEHEKLQRLYTQGGAGYGSVRNLVKASNLSVSKVTQFFHSKPSYTNFTLATRKFKQTNVFARFKNENWCMELSYDDQLAKDNNGVKHLLVLPDLFDGTVDAKGM